MDPSRWWIERRICSSWPKENTSRMWRGRGREWREREGGGERYGEGERREGKRE